MCWLQPSAKHHRAAHSLPPPVRWERETRKSTSEKTGWFRPRLFNEGRKEDWEKKENKWCKGNLSSSTSRLMTNQSLSKGYLPDQPLPPHFLLLTMMLYGMEYLFCHFKAAVQVIFPLNLLSILSLLPGWREEWVTENALMLYKQCSARASTSVCNQNCSAHKSKTQHHRGCSEGN